MPEPDFIRQLSAELNARISSALPMANAAREEVEKAVREAMDTTFRKFNLVTREEFDAQVEVLERAEKTIAALEIKISQLEKAAEES